MDIQGGVQDAIRGALDDKYHGAVNPCWVPTGYPEQTGRDQVQTVKFDIAVTVSDKESGTAETGIKVVGVRLGGEIAGFNETSHVSRIQFEIPIIPPVTMIKEDEVD